MWFVLVFLFLAVPASATQVMFDDADRMTVDRLSDDAADIFCGVCKDAKPENEAAVNFRTVYTFSVNDAIKGKYNAGDTVSFSQAGGFKGAVTYEKGKEYCLMLTGESKKSHLRAPVGIFYGKFDVLKSTDGKRTLRGTVSRKTLFRDVTTRRPSLSKSLTTREREVVESKDSRNIDYDDFVSILRKVSAEKTPR